MSDYSHEKKKYAKVVADAWRNATYRSELLANPGQVLSQAGLPPHGAQITVTPDSTAFSVNLGLPPKPSGVDDKDLEKWAEANLYTIFCC